MKKLCAILLSILLTYSVLTVSVSAEDSYEGIGFAIETTLTGKWTEKEETVCGFDCTVYIFSDEGNQLVITINESDPQGFVGYVKEELVPKSSALPDVNMHNDYAAYTVDIDGQEFSIVETMVLNGSDLSYNLYAYAANEETGYYIEMIAESESEYYLLLDSICNMELSTRKTGFLRSISSISDDEINITTIICVGIITSGIVALGVTAMVIFGKKKRTKI